MPVFYRKRLRAATFFRILPWTASPPPLSAPLHDPPVPGTQMFRRKDAAPDVHLAGDFLSHSRPYPPRGSLLRPGTGLLKQTLKPFGFCAVPGLSGESALQAAKLLGLCCPQRPCRKPAQQPASAGKDLNSSVPSPDGMCPAGPDVRCDREDRGSRPSSDHPDSPGLCCGPRCRHALRRDLYPESRKNRRSSKIFLDIILHAGL